METKELGSKQLRLNAIKENMVRISKSLVAVTDDLARNAANFDEALNRNGLTVFSLGIMQGDSLKIEAQLNALVEDLKQYKAIVDEP